jgi:hypothetical protein
LVTIYLEKSSDGCVAKATAVPLPHLERKAVMVSGLSLSRTFGESHLFTVDTTPH